MKNDYLWDGRGEPDPETQRLERLLGTLRYDLRAPDFPEISAPERPVRGGLLSWAHQAWRPAILAPALAGLILVAAAAWWALQTRTAYDIVSLQGNPRAGSTYIKKAGRLSVGQWLVTDAASRAMIKIGQIGEVEVDPNTSVGLVRAHASEHRLALQRGLIHALIWAPPGQFFVNTPSAVATDLGCAYTLQVDAEGAGLLTVTAGWVAFERDGREVFVPAGARCATRPGIGPGTPYLGDASAAFCAALAQLDFQSANPGSRVAVLKTVLIEAREQDALTLWHLLFRGDEIERGLVYERLAALVPPPAGVTRTGMLRRDQRMLDLWWNALGLGDTNWWRMWKSPWPADR